MSMSEQPIPRTFTLIYTRCETCGGSTMGSGVFNPESGEVTPLKPRHCRHCGHRLYETVESDV
jgi:hypothetical protein